MFSVTDILEIAIRLEENGEAVYLNAAKELDDGEFCDMLAWMAAEERSHAEKFFQMKAQIDTHEDRHILDEMRDTLINDYIGEKSFSLEDTSFSQIKDREDLIRTFIRFEEDTILFYEILKPFMEGSENDAVLQDIINDENGHIKRLKAFLPKEKV